jgi:NAD(P)-dependent dehydrogenase (short-subunit alcohol dehydrogenase family)
MSEPNQEFPIQSNKIAIVTGTGGLGFETAKVLARLGAHVTLAGRNPAKGTESVARILEAHPTARVRFAELDLASLTSVERFAQAFSAEHASLDILINNAGVMSLPERHTTTDGFELQLGTNFLGHFALTARLLPLLRRSALPRVVQLSSLAHRGGRIHFDDLQFERRYSPWAAYQQSKLAMLMFAFELQRRSDANGWGLVSGAAHPGYARTELIANGPGAQGLLWHVNRFFRPWVSQSAAEGSLPTLHAALSPSAEPGAYYGPDWLYELKGPPKKAFVAKQARDLQVAERLWEVSEKLVRLDFGARA